MKLYSDNLECVCCLLVSVTGSSPFASIDIYAQRPYAGENSLELVANSLKKWEISPGNLDLGLSTKTWQPSLHLHMAFMTWRPAGTVVSP